MEENRILREGEEKRDDNKGRIFPDALDPKQLSSSLFPCFSLSLKREYRIVQMHPDRQAEQNGFALHEPTSHSSD
jgi:inorganic triphosphatase YgiF